MSVKVHVPCCVKCAAALERRHFWKAVALYASGILGAVACLAVILWTSGQGMSSGAGAALGIAALLAVLAVPVVYEMKHPPAFTTTPLEGRVTYEFVSAKFLPRQTPATTGRTISEGWKAREQCRA